MWSNREVALRSTGRLGGRRWRRRPTRRRRRGQSLVEFALILPVFFLLLGGIIDGSWYVFETSALTNSARQAARWEVSAANFDQSAQPPQPYCQDSTPTIPPAMVAAAQHGAGPFGGVVSSGMANSPGPSDSAGYNSCTVTITAQFAPFDGLVRIGPLTITSQFTAFTD